MSVTFSQDMLVLGSVALDTVETERGFAEESLGGSAAYAALAASYFVRPRVVGVVGDDFPPAYKTLLAQRADVSELVTLPGRTFRWHAEHSLETEVTTTKKTELNTYEHFRPVLSARAASAPYVLLGNIDPELQLYVLDQLTAPRVVASDTMSLWIRTAKESVLAVMRRVDLFFLNEQESYELTGVEDVDGAGTAMLEMGARQVVIKCGPRPTRLYTPSGRYIVGTIPGVDVVDPTGAGDSFAGAMVGYLAQIQASTDDPAQLVRAMHYGTVVAAHAIEAFGANAHQGLTLDLIEQRLHAIRPAS